MLRSGLEGPRPSFLVLDPAGELQNLIRALLLPIADRILLADNSRDGLATVRTERPDAVIAACGLGKGGLGLCRRLRQDPLIAATPFIVVTSSSDLDDYAAYLEHGCDQILPLPFRCQEFYATLRSALARGRDTERTGIQVLFKTGRADFVDRHELDRLIAGAHLLCFQRQGGIARIGRDPLRGAGSGRYAGVERRRLKS